MKYIKELKDYFDNMEDKTREYKTFIIDRYKTFEFYLLPCIIINKWCRRKILNKEVLMKREISLRWLKWCVAIYFKK